MQLIPLGSLIVLLPALVLPEVMPPEIARERPFAKCTQFFVKQENTVIFPTIFNQVQYKQICQKYMGQYEFATLYNTEHRIPVYSAYLYQGNQDCDRKNTWLIEPQLDNPNGSPEMASESKVPEQVLGSHQALNTDYPKREDQQTKYDRGHLYPVFHTFKQCTADATFTLTNAAPQILSFNRGMWRSQVEKPTKDFLAKNCSSDFAYVVTGVVPGTETLNNRVIIPSSFWSAYCCLRGSGKPPQSAAFISPNRKVDNIPQISVAELNSKLSDQNHYGTAFSVFGNLCR